MRVWARMVLASNLLEKAQQAAEALRHVFGPTRPGKREWASYVHEASGQLDRIDRVWKKEMGR